jgi:hypothetical protein
LLGKPLVGCHSHRFNLECQAFLVAHETLLDKVSIVFPFSL